VAVVLSPKTRSVTKTYLTRRKRLRKTNPRQKRIPKPPREKI